MPIEVDADQRLREIAEATLRVAEREGPNAITIRSVAAELGGSTTVVTNFLATRSDLLLNVIQYARAGWKAEFRPQAEALSGRDLFRALSLWSCTTTGGDHAVRQIGTSLASRVEDGSDAQAALREDAVEHHQELLSALREGNVKHPEIGADLMHLVLRGFYADSVIDPENWNEARAQAAVGLLCDLLLGDAETGA